MSSSQTSSSSSEPGDAAFALAALADVACGVDFVIGTSRMTVGECLHLARHSVLRLGQPAGSDLEVRVNGVAIAFGEVAVVDDIAGLRITRIAVPTGVGWE
ncbi:MAG: FliM/FliN family flagellar motor switch protein [Vicinamibacterales bacterium]